MAKEKTKFRRFQNKKIIVTAGFVTIIVAIAINYYINQQPYHSHDEILLATLLATTLFAYGLVFKLFVTPLHKLKTAILGKHTSPGKDEVKQVIETFNRVQENIQSATAFIQDIEKGNLDTSYNGHSKDDQGNLLASSLLSMREQMKKIAKQESERNWTTEGLTKFIEILRANSSDINSLCYDITANLVKYLNANQGGLFITTEDEVTSETSLELIACYAYERKKHITKNILVGEGLTGQCLLEKETIYLTDIPSDYIHITSGLGKSNPKAILIVPLKLNDQVYGVIELASFSEFPAYQRAFVEKLGESIASAISTVKVNERTRILLEESQQMTEQMRAQEEEMRQNLEELNATQEELQRKEIELDQQLKQTLKELELSQAKQLMNEITLFIEHSIDSTKRDIKFLSKVPPVISLVGVKETMAIAKETEQFQLKIGELALIFDNFLRTKETFHSLTFASAEGLALLSLQWKNNQVENITSTITNLYLQETFKACVKTPKGEILVGPVKTLDENTIVMEFGMPVFNDDGTLKGILLLNLLTEAIIENIRSKQKQGSNFSLTGPKGEQLFGLPAPKDVQSLSQKIIINPKNNVCFTLVHHN
jgi:GAF domain-containing protein